MTNFESLECIQTEIEAIMVRAGVSGGSSGSVEPLDFEKGAMEPLKFLRFGEMEPLNF